MAKALVVSTSTGEVRETTTDALACDTCKHFACVCGIREKHHEECRFRVAATCAIPIECDHGRDVCPTCDPCTCEEQG
jgi:hypothetical protein